MKDFTLVNHVNRADCGGFGGGRLYPALCRMEAKGWIAAEWAQSDNNRRAKYYRLTKVGRKQLDVEKLGWIASRA